MLLGDVDWGLNSQDIARERHQNESAFIGAINNFEGTIRIGLSSLRIYDSDTIRNAEAASETDTVMRKQRLLLPAFPWLCYCAVQPTEILRSSYTARMPVPRRRTSDYQPK